MKKLFLVSGLFFLLVTGCATIQPVDTSQVTYKSDSFIYSDFTHSSLAVLPVLTNVPKYEGIRRQTGQSLARAIKRQYPSIKIKSPRETLNMINKNEMSDIYSDMMTDYSKTGILNQNTMSQMGKALKSRFMLYTRLGAEETVDTEYSSSMGVTQSRASELNIYSQLWDTEKGDVVWEGTGGAAMIQSSTGNVNADLINLASNNLAQRLGKSASEVNSPENVQKLHNQQQMNYQMAYAGVSILAALIVLATL